MKVKYVSSLLALISGAGIGYYVIKKRITKKKTDNENVMIVSPKRYEVGFALMNQWIKLKNEGKNFEKYFHDKDIKRVAIYGLGALGERLYEDLLHIDIEVVYGIDRIADSKKIEGLRIVKPNELLEAVDRIIVTPVQDYPYIEYELSQNTSSHIISLEDILQYCR